MSYQPLTREQYQKARDAGYSHEKIIEMEKIRKSRSPSVESAQGVSGLGGVGVGALKGIGSTLRGLGQLSEGFANQTAGRVVSAIQGKGFVPQDTTDSLYNDKSEVGGKLKSALTPRGTAENIGYSAERISEFFVPAAKIAQVGKAAQMAIRSAEKAPPSLRKLGGLGARAGVEGTGAGAIEAAQQGKLDDSTAFTFGLGAGVPVLARALPSITGGVSSLTTGVPKETISRAASPEYAVRIDNALKEIADNPKQPLFSLAKRLQESINTNIKSAKDAFVIAKDTFKAQNPGATFDMRNRLAQFIAPLKQFNLDTKIIPPKSPKDVTFGIPKIVRRPQSPFSDSDISNLQTLVNKIQTSKNATLDDLLDLEKSFGAAYQAKPLGPNQSPTQYHAAVMALKENAEKMIEEALPKSLQAAYRRYRRVNNLKEIFGSRIVDASGKLKDGAEQYLTNLVNMNKGNLRTEIAGYADDIGFDLIDEIQVIKDAQKLNEFFPATGSRTQDVLRSLAVAGFGLGTGGPLMGLLGLAASSPKVIGKAAVGIGRLREKLPAIPKYLK